MKYWNEGDMICLMWGTVKNPYALTAFQWIRDGVKIGNSGKRKVDGLEHISHLRKVGHEWMEKSKPGPKRTMTRDFYIAKGGVFK